MNKDRDRSIALDVKLGAQTLSYALKSAGSYTRDDKLPDRATCAQQEAARSEAGERCKREEEELREAHAKSEAYYDTGTEYLRGRRVFRDYPEYWLKLKTTSGCVQALHDITGVTATFVRR